MASEDREIRDIVAPYVRTDAIIEPAEPASGPEKQFLHGMNIPADELVTARVRGSARIMNVGTRDHSSSGTRQLPAGASGSELATTSIDLSRPRGIYLLVDDHAEIMNIGEEGIVVVGAVGNVNIMNSHGKVVAMAKGNVDVHNLDDGEFLIKSKGNLHIMNIGDDGGKGRVSIKAEVDGNLDLMNIGPNVDLEVIAKGGIAVFNVHPQANVTINGRRYGASRTPDPRDQSAGLFETIISGVRGLLGGGRSQGEPAAEDAARIEATRDEIRRMLPPGSDPMSNPDAARRGKHVDDVEERGCGGQGGGHTDR